MLYYATADKTRLVPEGDPDAAYTVNGDSPGEFAPLIKAQAEAEETARREAEKAEAEEAKARAEAEAAAAEEKPQRLPVIGEGPERSTGRRR